MAPTERPNSAVRLSVSVPVSESSGSRAVGGENRLREACRVLGGRLEAQEEALACHERGGQDLNRLRSWTREVTCLGTYQRYQDGPVVRSELLPMDSPSNEASADERNGKSECAYVHGKSCGVFFIHGAQHWLTSFHELRSRIHLGYEKPRTLRT